jgi:predicted nuclease with TOPRIM domain
MQTRSSFQRVANSWPVISSLAIAVASLIWWTAISYGQLSRMDEDIAKIKSVHPIAVSEEVERHEVDMKLLRDKLETIGNDTSYTRGKLDSLDGRFADLDARLQRLESRVDSMKGSK